MINNIELLELCFSNPEMFSEDAYIHTDSVTPIITESNERFNELMRANLKIIENISAFKVATESNNQQMIDTAVDNIYTALDTEGINYSEFSSYWAVRDMTYSIYDKLNVELKKEFIAEMVKHYIQDRHQIYLNHGYSNTTLQAVADSKAHKVNGVTGIKKVSSILDSFGFPHLESQNLNEFINNNKAYIYPDKSEKELFHRIIEHYGIKFLWSPHHDNKQTDFLVKYNNNIIIMEHKHMKEGGGGQDKQINEIIDFVSYTENIENIVVRYVSFLDGLYFNMISNADINGRAKPSTQKRNIYDALRENPLNFFVNTHGFKVLMSELLRD